MQSLQKTNHFLLGIAFTFAIAILGYLLMYVPIINRLGSLASAIFIAVLYRNIIGYPNLLRSGITFSSAYFLRLAIILYGLKLNIRIILDEGILLIFKSVLILILSITLMLLIGKLLKADKHLSTLLAIGTGICGAAAIAATAPIIKAKESDTAISIAIIAFIGTVFSISYTFLLPLLPITDKLYSLWAGLSLHELAHVALAAEPVSDTLLATALLAKLSRVFLLVPFSIILVIWMKIKDKKSTKENVKITIPYFLIGFIFMSLFGSFGLGTWIVPPSGVMEFIDKMTMFLLSAAMVGLGLHVDLKAIREKAIRPLIAMIITSLIISLVAYFLVLV